MRTIYQPNKTAAWPYLLAIFVICSWWIALGHFYGPKKTAEGVVPVIADTTLVQDSTPTQAPKQYFSPPANPDSSWALAFNHYLQKTAEEKELAHLQQLQDSADQAWLAAQKATQAEEAEEAERMRLLAEEKERQAKAMEELARQAMEEAQTLEEEILAEEEFDYSDYNNYIPRYWQFLLPSWIFIWLYFWRSRRNRRQKQKMAAQFPLGQRRPSGALSRDFQSKSIDPSWRRQLAQERSRPLLSESKEQDVQWAEGFKGSYTTTFLRRAIIHLLRWRQPELARPADFRYWLDVYDLMSPLAAALQCSLALWFLDQELWPYLLLPLALLSIYYNAAARRKSWAKNTYLILASSLALIAHFFFYRSSFGFSEPALFPDISAWRWPLLLGLFLVFWSWLKGGKHLFQKTVWFNDESFVKTIPFFIASLFFTIFWPGVLGEALPTGSLVALLLAFVLWISSPMKDDRKAKQWLLSGGTLFGGLVGLSTLLFVNYNIFGLGFISYSLLGFLLLGSWAFFFFPRMENIPEEQKPIPWWEDPQATIREELVIKDMDLGLQTEHWSSFNRFKRLKTIRLVNTELKHLPIRIANLAQLEEMDIRHNQLRTIPSIFFKRLPNLKKINLAGNPVPAKKQQELSQKYPHIEFIFE
ncbi:leucine-rich repeat domain-containing protein [Saprospira grandis]|uniref:Leucine-rich repeat containing protein n=1 Tax=Saprospira grandis (strain Lewin) TaxID=984262 RepID=H6L5N3_SAPGL|nr:leucine-rich repeat domain-containing protein [Saprospira grandis]AFC26283.1 leucine-rich repeat containing protein [Saprospira grandis str. Lewin]